MTLRAQRLARTLPASSVETGEIGALGRFIEDEPKTMRGGMVEVYRTVTEPGRPLDVAFWYGAQSTLPKDLVHASADRLAARAAASVSEETQKKISAQGGRSCDPRFPC